MKDHIADAATRLAQWALYSTATVNEIADAARVICRACTTPTEDYRADDHGEHFMDDDGRPQGYENEQHAAEMAMEPDCPF